MPTTQDGTTRPTKYLRPAKYGYWTFVDVDVHCVCGGSFGIHDETDGSERKECPHCGRPYVVTIDVTLAKEAQ